MRCPTFASIVLSLLLAAACTSAPTAPTLEVRQTLAPTDRLRVGLYPGTPTSIIGDPASATAKGVGFDLGTALARRTGVTFEPVVYPKNAEVLAAVKSGAVDMVFTNATPPRMKDMDFSPTVLQVEQGYLVPRGSTIVKAGDVDSAGIRVGVSEGSTSEVTLSREFRLAALVRTPSLKAAVEMLAAGKLDAFATNKATLYEMSDELPGSRVLDGRWGLENFAIAIPKGREAAMPYVASFVAQAKADGVVAQAVERAGLRGTVAVDLAMSQGASITIQDFQFSPDTITVRRGATVAWTNVGSVAHTVTRPSEGGIQIAGPNSGLLKPGDTYGYTYSAVGLFDYRCSIHPSMHGTVEVTQ